MATLPIIDISPFLPSSSPERRTPKLRAATAQQVHDACTEYGFFYIAGTGLSDKELHTPLEAAKDFFARPQEEKDALRIQPDDGARGYQRLGQNITQYKADHHEGWDAYADFPSHLLTSSLTSTTLTGENRWPAQPSAFKTIMQDWVSKMRMLGIALLEAAAMGLGVEGVGTDRDPTSEWSKLRAMVEESFWVMRAIAYPPLPDDAEGISCGAHTDYGNFTLLHTDSTPSSLQVFRPSPTAPLDPETHTHGTWLNADPIPGCLVVNIGVMWSIWSNGLYEATLHRVVHRSLAWRYSLPFFSEPNFDAFIEPLEAAIRLQKAKIGKEPLRKPGVVYGDYLRGKVEGNFVPSTEV